MIKIRLKRLGAKRNPIYRVIVIDGREKREGRPIEELGFYNPKRKELRLNKESALAWIKKGAQPTETVQYLINNSDDAGNLVRKEVEQPKLSKKAQAKTEAEAKAKAEAEEKAKEEAKAKKEAETKAEETKVEEPAVETEVKAEAEEVKAEEVKSEVEPEPEAEKEKAEEAETAKAE